MIYFDNAATSFPKPRPVAKALSDALSLFGGNPGRGAHRLSLASAEMVYDCRAAIADAFRVDTPERVVFTSGATMAINLAIRTRITRGAHLLISDREHNAVLRTVEQLRSEMGISYDVYPTSGNVIDAIEGLLRPNTVMVIACHISNVTGFTLPIAEIGTFCEEKKLYFVVDAAQSAGSTPISLADFPCDAFCAPAHKGLLGVSGLGFAILSQGEERAPFITGGSGVDSLSLTMPKTLPERYEAGTLPIPAIAALREGLRLLEREGIAATAKRENGIRQEIANGMKGIRGVRIFEESAGKNLIAFCHERIPPDEIAHRLDEHGICVRAGYHCAPLAHRTVGTPVGGCVRVSIGYGNRFSEAAVFLNVLSDILKRP